MLCSTCSQMSQAVLEGQGLVSGDHHQSLVSFLNAAQAGCYICDFARQRLSRADKEDNYQLEHFKLCYSRGRSSFMIIFDIKPLHDEKSHKTAIPFHTLRIPGLTVTESENVRRRRGCIPEAEAVKKIREWMGLCLRDHEGTRCWKNDTEPGSYPSRLLELAPSSFRILRTAVDRPQGPYVTLSYCWGPNPAFLRLTAWNEKELEAGVSTSRLPLAFQEAISVIQGLSLRYVWIDSLCIIQRGPGSADEWETESARMHKIYADSVLTLALACVASPEESILNQYPTNKSAATLFTIRSDSDPRDSADNGVAIVPNDYFAHGVYEQPLGSRAWALQERIMAARVVSLGLGELFWDCAQLPYASESIPGGLKATLSEWLNLPKKAIPDGSSKDVLLDTWWSLLGEYTARSLTFPEKDKLMALSAIARDTGKAMGDVYIAGHFWKTFPASLSWFPVQARRLFWSEEHGAAEDGPRTPSWSWASFNGKISWDVGSLGPCTELAEAVSYTLELANKANPTGPCNFASVSIRTYCTEVEWGSQNEPVMVVRTEGQACDNIKLRLQLDEPGVRRTTGTRSLMLPLIEVKLVLGWKGLVVERIQHDSEGRIRYRRIGHFALWKIGSTRWQERCSIFGEEKRLFELV